MTHHSRCFIYTIGQQFSEDMYCSYSCFIDENPKAQRGEVACPRPHSQLVMRLGVEHKQKGPVPACLSIGCTASRTKLLPTPSYFGPSALLTACSHLHPPAAASCSPWTISTMSLVLQPQAVFLPNHSITTHTHTHTRASLSPELWFPLLLPNRAW